MRTRSTSCATCLADRIHQQDARKASTPVGHENGVGPPGSDLQPPQSRTGTMRLVEPAPDSFKQDSTQSEQDQSSSLPHHVFQFVGEEGIPGSSSQSFIAPLPQHGTMSSFSSYPLNSNHGRRSDSLGSDDSFDHDESRESTGFRHAVLAALGFSSSHSRPISGSVNVPSTTDRMRQSGVSVSSPIRDGGEAAHGHRIPRQATELFSLPPTGARSSESSQPIGLGLDYSGTRTESHVSHPSQSTWDALYREHSTDLELDADMLDFSSLSHMSNSRSGSISVFASATPASATRSPAMMSTGPMPHSEQFHYETDEPVPAIPSDKLNETDWTREEQRDMALFTGFSSPKTTSSALPYGLDASGARQQSRSGFSAAEPSASFPLPPARHIATSPNSLRPRPSNNALRPSPETSSPIKGDITRRLQGLPSSESLANRRLQGEKAIDPPPPASLNVGPSIFSSTSIFSTDTFGGSAPGPQQIVQGSGSAEGPPNSAQTMSGETNSRQSISRFSHLFAEGNRRSSAISSSEPLSGNTFSSFRQQQRRTSKTSLNDDVANVEDTARISLRPISESNSELNSRWSMSSFPGQPIVPAEVYQQAVSGHTLPSATNPSLRATTGGRPLPIAVPIATGLPIDIRNEHVYDPRTVQQAQGDGSSDMFIRDASGTANAHFDIRLAPPASSKAASFLTARSHSDSARSHTDSGSTPQDSPMDIEASEPAAQRLSEDVIHQGQLAVLPHSASASSAVRRSKFSNSSSSSAFAANLQPLDEQFEDGVEVEDVEDEQFGLARSQSQAVHGR